MRKEDGFRMNLLVVGCEEMLQRNLKMLGLARELQDVEEGEEDDSRGEEPPIF